MEKKKLISYLIETKGKHNVIIVQYDDYVIKFELGAVCNGESKKVIIGGFKVLLLNAFHDFDYILDKDEDYIKSNQTGYFEKTKEKLYGNILIFGLDEENNPRSLNAEEIEAIQKNMIYLIVKENDSAWGINIREILRIEDYVEV